MATADDSAMVFAAGGTSSSGDDRWKAVKISAVGVAVTNCSWPGAPAVDLGLDLLVSTPDDTAGIAVGASFQAFRRVDYGLFQADGRWWLGRKVGAAASYEKLAGPLEATNGLEFAYYDRAGNATADPTQVSVVEIILRGESFGKARGTSGITGYQQDSLVTKVVLRG